MVAVNKDHLEELKARLADLEEHEATLAHRQELAQRIEWLEAELGPEEPASVEEKRAKAGAPVDRTSAVRRTTDAPTVRNK